MTPISKPLTYTDLLLQYQPKPIKTRPDYEQTLSIIEGMMSQNLTQDEELLFELLVLLIETYENEHCPINKATPQATLESLIHEFDVDCENLLDIFGNKKTVEEVMTGEKEISPLQAESLANFFNRLSPKLALTSRSFLSN
jgi:HTH-type transcriptional regulator/antitoxin HigA